MYSFFAMLSRMKYINRWGLMKNSRYENLTEHSAQTAMIAHCLAVIGNKIYGKSYDPDRIALFALYHDVSELVTGDLPTPVKYYNDDILKSYREIEEHAKEQILKKLPSELYDEYFDCVKLATRTATRPLYVVKSYINGACFGNLLDLLEPNHTKVLGENKYLSNQKIPKEWFSKVTSCNKDCYTCGYCKEADCF